MPNTETFPFEEISVKYKDGSQVKLEGKELGWALQYGPSQGYPPLLEKMKEFQNYWSKPSYDNWDIIITNGSMDACNKVFEMTLELGDPMMLQAPAYNGTLNSLIPMLPEFLEIKQDKHGIIPDEISKICEQRLRDGKKMPKILYVNPTGSNPTGIVMPLSRKKEVYALAQKYDFLIIEDDPYEFLHFLDKQPTTFLQLDTEGRVLRLDSFSKILSSGLRLGVVTAHKTFIERLILHMDVTGIHAASLSQMLLYKLLSAWDNQKLQKHFNGIQKFYRERRDTMLACLDMHLTGLAEWNVPDGGMFVWIKLPGIKDVSQLAKEKSLSKGIFIIPGHAFNCDSSKPDQHIRLSYSYATPAEIEKAIPILAQLIREEMKMKNGVSK
ncbi:kynurenine/alpha-aminoadipate aminotransferase, mitochondrial isoform X2 [Augochlora pura]